MSEPEILLHWLDQTKTAEFPHTSQALTNPNGLLAAGGDLSVTRLEAAYRRGIFPWYSEGEPILWWCPNPRTIFRPAQIHVSRSLARELRKDYWAVTFDQAFTQVLDGCSEPRKHESGTWLTDEMKAAYAALYLAGHAHSIELWHQQTLIGGLYGVSLGRVFFGESMFSRRSNASKIVLAQLGKQLARWNFKLLDCQVDSDHLFRMGAMHLEREEFEGILSNACDDNGPNQWAFDADLRGNPNNLPAGLTRSNAGHD